MQNPMNPEAGTNPLIDKLIGNAYDVVKYVAHYVKEIRYVALNMADVHRVSQGMYENVLLVATIEDTGTELTIALPEGVVAAMVLNSSVNVVTADGQIYPSGSNSFTWVIGAGELVVTFSETAPVEFEGASLRWLLNWQSPIQVG